MVLRIGMQPDEVHPQLRQLGDDGQVFVAVPPVRAFGEIVEGLDSAQGEERGGMLVQGWHRPTQQLVGDNVAVQVEANAQCLSKAVGGVERADIIAASEEENP